MTEQEYIASINERDQIIDEYETMLKQALARVNELELRITLRDASKEGRKANAEMLAKENELDELRSIVELTSAETFKSREHLEASYIKKLAAIRAQFETMAKTKRCRAFTVEAFELSLAELDVILGENCHSLASAYDKISEYKSKKEDPAIIPDLIEVIEELIYACKTYQRLNKSQGNELSSLRDAVKQAYSGSTPEQLLSLIDNQKALIDGYKKKIEALEFELHRQNK